MMRSLPVDAGVEVRYAAPPEAIATVLPGVLAARRLALVVGPTADSTATMAIAESPMGLFSYGEYVRVRAESRLGQRSVVRVAARSKYLLDASGRVDRVTPRLLQTLDSALGPGAAGPFTGDRIRGRVTTGGPVVTGRVTDGPGGVPHLAPDGGGPATPVADLLDVAIHRGRYAHRGEGAPIGMLLGLVVGVVAAQQGVSSSDPYRDATIAQGALLGMVVGAAAGFVAGAAFRTTVWSEVR